LGIAVLSLIVSAANVLFIFTPLSKYAYRKANIFIVEKGDSIVAGYDPTARKLRFTFRLTVLNAGNRDGKLAADLARLTDSEEEEEDLIPFDSSDIQFVEAGQTSESIIVPKGDFQKTLTCTLGYQVSDIGLPVLRKTTPKILTVHLRGEDKPLVIKYYLKTWTPNLLDSKSMAQRTLYER
jgi:hypothetical protein